MSEADEEQQRRGDPETELDRALTEEPRWQGGDTTYASTANYSAYSESSPMADDIPTSGLDSLREPDRDLYERTRFKMFLSLIYGALTLMFLGFCAEAGGKSTGFNYYLQRSTAKNIPSQTVDLSIKVYNYLDASCLTLLVGGYGFSSFCHFCAFVIAAVAAILSSPYLTGSHKEVSILRGPVDFHREVYKKKSSRGSTFSIPLPPARL